MTVQDVNDLIYKPVKSKDDVNRLLQIHKNLVYWCLGKMGLLHDQECESVAWEALWDAINRFDVFGKAAFSSFAVRCIRNRIGDLLRKRKTQLENETSMPTYFEVEDNASPVESRVEASATLDAVLKIFDEYINMKSGVSRNVLLVWQAADFDIEANMIAKICGTTSTTVGKVLVSFRAYLATRLRD